MSQKSEGDTVRLKHDRKSSSSSKRRSTKKHKSLRRIRSKTNAVAPSSPSADRDSVIKEQHKVSMEWMKITAERVEMDRERVLMKKEEQKLSKMKKESAEELHQLQTEKKALSALRKKWKKESADLMAEIDAKYTTLKRQRPRTDKKEWIDRRRISLEDHVQDLHDLAASSMSTPPPMMNTMNSKETQSRSHVDDHGDGERLKLQRLQKEQKQKLAQKTLEEYIRKKQELKTERAAVEEQKERFKRMEREYNQFLVEKKRLRREKQQHLHQKKKLTAAASNQTRAAMLEAAQLEAERDKMQRSRAVLEHKHKMLSSQDTRRQLDFVGTTDSKEFREMKRKLTMYRDNIERLENQNKVLQRKVNKREKLANDYTEDAAMRNGDDLSKRDTKYLISTLRAKVLEFQNKNKLLLKLIKRHKAVKDAYHSISDLKTAKKLISKLVIENEELKNRAKVLSSKLSRLKDLGDKYATKLFKEYDDDEDGDDDENGDDEKDENRKDFDFERMETEEVQTLYDSMKEKIAELMLKMEKTEDKLQEKETEIAKYESFANEWDLQQRLGEDRARAMFGKLRIQNEALQSKLDQVYSNLEREKAAATTWRNTIEDKILRNDEGDDDDAVSNEEKRMLIKQLKAENKSLQTQIEFMNKEDIKMHKAIAMDISEQFGSALFSNLQYILMDADLSDDDQLRFKIKDKNDQLYHVVLTKDGAILEAVDEVKEAEEEKSSPSPPNKKFTALMFEEIREQNMMNKMKRIERAVNDYDQRMIRIISMIQKLKDSKRIVGRDRIKSVTSLASFDSVYDLSYEDNLTRAMNADVKYYF